MLKLNVLIRYISHTSPKDAELAFIEKKTDQFKLKKGTYILYSVSVTNGSHKFRKDLFCCLNTSYGMIIDTVTFDKELWDDMKDKFILYYENFYLKTFFVK